ncbi:MAG: hypothetical protein HC828_02240 [Blastochloris sp.]|nr:hypothetical protein [Blastochloris sp.]
MCRIYLRITGRDVSGRTIPARQQHGADPIAAACAAAGGEVLFSGKISAVDWCFERGYYFATGIIEGGGDWRGETGQFDPMRY